MRFCPSLSWPSVPDAPPEAVSWKQHWSARGSRAAEAPKAIPAAVANVFILAATLQSNDCTSFGGRVRDERKGTCAVGKGDLYSHLSTAPICHIMRSTYYWIELTLRRGGEYERNIVISSRICLNCSRVEARTLLTPDQCSTSFRLSVPWCPRIDIEADIRYYIVPKRHHWSN